MREANGDRVDRLRVRAADEIAPVWVLDDPTASQSGQAIGIAERLGVPHLRVPLAWNWAAALAALSRRGSLRGLQGGGVPSWPFSAPQGPALAISAGTPSEAVALWLRARFGSRIVHCLTPHFGLRRRAFDLLVASRHDQPPARSNVLPVLGVTHRLSPLILSQAKVAWAGRLAHMPRPIVTLLVGGSPAMERRPAMAHALARQVAALAAAAGGSVLATTSPRTGPDVTEATSAGLSPAMNLLYRWGEPGENPYTGFLALADAIVVTGDSISMLSEACSSEAPVFIAARFIAGRGDAARLRRMHRTFYQAGQARPLDDSLSPWPRTVLDETGRVAAEIRARMSLGPQAVD